MTSRSPHIIVPDSLAGVLGLLERSSVAATFVLATDGRFRRANALCRRWLTGRAAGELGRLSPADWLPRSADREILLRANRGESMADVSLELGGAGCEARFIRGDLIPMPRPGGGVLGIFRDATAEQRLHESVERGARLEALGCLTVGVAHDFNNLLTILVGNLALAAEDLREDDKQFARLKVARDAARRGGDLIGQLLAFARQEPVPSEPIDPAKVIAGLVPLIQRALGKRIEFVAELDESVPPVVGNAAQLESVIVNLAVNARDAIDAEGTVCVRVARDAARSGPASVLVEVVDDGCGMPVHVVERVLEPFFTTKGEGQGSGLGLSMVHAYAENFSGTVEIDSREGEGTRVSLRFPAIAAEVDDRAAMTAPVAALPAGKERILLLAAEENLRSMMQQILSVLGYRCDTAADLGEANRCMAGAVPDLVVSDGFDVGLLLEAGARRAGVRVLKLTGPADEGVRGGTATLQKPFSLPDLAIAVRAALDAESAGLAAQR